MRRFAGLAALLGALSLAAPAVAAPALKLERVVLLMRHGVRPPTRADVTPPGYAKDPWPTWEVPLATLTPHGADAIRRLGDYERETFRAQGLLPARGCPPAGAVDAYADMDQRTIATADILLETLAPGCGLVSRHLAQGGPRDPLFLPIALGLVEFNPARAEAEVRKRYEPYGITRLYQNELRNLDVVLGGSKSLIALGGDFPDTKPYWSRLKGAFDYGPTVAQTLLLEYVNGKPMSEVGWGRADADLIAGASQLHAFEFSILQREPYVAARNAGPLARRMLAQLSDAGPLRYGVIVGHDTNIAALAGLLNLAPFTTPGAAADDPTPGGALVFERLSDGQGRTYVRAVWLAQSLDQMRELTVLDRRHPPTRQVLAIPGCLPSPTLCALDQFAAMILNRAVAPRVSPQTPAVATGTH